MTVLLLVRVFALSRIYVCPVRIPRLQDTDRRWDIWLGAVIQGTLLRLTTTHHTSDTISTQ